MTPTITSGSPLDVPSMAVHQNVSCVSLKYLIDGTGAGAGVGAGADEKNQHSKSGDHERPDTRVLGFLIAELKQTGWEELCEMLQMHLQGASGYGHIPYPDGTHWRLLLSGK